MISLLISMMILISDMVMTLGTAVTAVAVSLEMVEAMVLLQKQMTIQPDWVYTSTTVQTKHRSPHLQMIRLRMMPVFRWAISLSPLMEKILMITMKL